MPSQQGMTERLKLDQIELADFDAARALARELHRQLRNSDPRVDIGNVEVALDIERVKLKAFDGF